MSILNYLAQLGQRITTYHQKAKTLENLQSLSDEQLADIGISRHLLGEGVAAYPWRIEETGLQQPTSTAVLLQFRSHAATANSDTYDLRQAA